MSKIVEQLEAAILGKVIMVLIEEDYRVEVSDQDGGGLFVYAWPADKDRPEKINHWVNLVPGNGPDYISNYTTNLEKVLKPVNDFCEFYRD